MATCNPHLKTRFIFCFLLQLLVYSNVATVLKNERLFTCFSCCFHSCSLTNSDNSIFACDLQTYNNLTLFNWLFQDLGICHAFSLWHVQQSANYFNIKVWNFNLTIHYQLQTCEITSACAYSQNWCHFNFCWINIILLSLLSLHLMLQNYKLWCHCTLY